MTESRPLVPVTAKSIGYITENDKDYVAGLKAAQDEKSLRLFLASQRFIAADAYKAISSGEFDWAEFIKGRKQENAGHYAGDKWNEKYGAILMPEILIRVGILANEYKVPWGLAYIRYRDAGKIIETATEAKWNEI